MVSASFRISKFVGSPPPIVQLPLLSLHPHCRSPCSHLSPCFLLALCPTSSCLPSVRTCTLLWCVLELLWPVFSMPGPCGLFRWSTRPSRTIPRWAVLLLTFPLKRRERRASAPPYTGSFSFFLCTHFALFGVGRWGVAQACLLIAIPLCLAPL